MALFSSLTFSMLHGLESYLLLYLLHVQIYSLLSVLIFPEI